MIAPYWLRATMLATALTTGSLLADAVQAQEAAPRGGVIVVPDRAPDGGSGGSGGSGADAAPRPTAAEAPPMLGVPTGPDTLNPTGRYASGFATDSPQKQCITFGTGCY